MDNEKDAIGVLFSCRRLMLCWIWCSCVHSLLHCRTFSRVSGLMKWVPHQWNRYLSMCVENRSSPVKQAHVHMYLLENTIKTDQAGVYIHAPSFMVIELFVWGHLTSLLLQPEMLDTMYLISRTTTHAFAMHTMFVLCRWLCHFEQMQLISTTVQ